MNEAITGTRTIFRPHLMPVEKVKECLMWIEQTAFDLEYSRCRKHEIEVMLPQYMEVTIEMYQRSVSYRDLGIIDKDHTVLMGLGCVFNSPTHDVYVYKKGWAMYGDNIPAAKYPIDLSEVITNV